MCCFKSGGSGGAVAGRAVVLRSGSFHITSFLGRMCDPWRWSLPLDDAVHLFSPRRDTTVLLTQMKHLGDAAT